MKASAKWINVNVTKQKKDTNLQKAWRNPQVSRSAPLSDSLLPLTATCGGLFTSCHRLPHVGEQSVLIHSTVRSINLAPVTHYLFLFIQAYALFLCRYVIYGLSYHACWDLLSSILRSVSRIPRRGVVNPLDSGSGFGARDVHLFFSIIRPSGVGSGSLFLHLAFCFVLDVNIRSFLINFTPLFCSALESSVLFPVASLTLKNSKEKHTCM